MAYIIIAGSIVALVFLVAVLLFNRLVRLRNKVDTAWRQIDVQLKRRYDLVPRLVAIAQGYAIHEKDVLTSVTRARAEAQSASSPGTKGPAENGLSAALSGIMLLAENYPDLKAEQEFEKLTGELVRTETAIAGSRKYYNGSVMQYDNSRQSFPGNIVAGALPGSFQPREYFELDDVEMRSAPEATWS